MTTMMVLLEVAGMVALAKMGAAFAASIAVVGAATGIGRIGVQALDAIALIEGLAFFAIIVAMLVLFLA